MPSHARRNRRTQTDTATDGELGRYLLAAALASRCKLPEWETRLAQITTELGVPRTTWVPETLAGMRKDPQLGAVLGRIEHAEEDQPMTRLIIRVLTAETRSKA